MEGSKYFGMAFETAAATVLIGVPTERSQEILVQRMHDLIVRLDSSVPAEAKVRFR